MRVLFWSDLFWPYIGGSEIFASKLLLALRERHEFVVVTRQDSPDLPSEDSYSGVPVYRLPFFTALVGRDMVRMIALRRQVAGLKRKFAPDLIHIHNFGLSILFHLETAGASAAPMLFTATLEILPGARSGPDTLLRRTLRAADWVTGVSSDTLAQARSRAPEIISRSSVIFNGLDAPALLPEPLPIETPRLLCLGRLQTQKGFDLVLSALPAIIDRFPQVRLTIAGDGPERAALEHQASELKLAGVVNFTGWVSPDRVPELINSATIVLMPSRWEGFGLVALEAGWMARPVIASRVGGLPEVIAQGETGILVESENSRALADAIVLLLTDPEKAVRIGQAARRRAQELFSWERCVAAYDTLYRRWTQEPPQHRLQPPTR
jgi:glycogen(starch) synthase